MGLGMNDDEGMVFVKHLHLVFGVFQIGLELMAQLFVVYILAGESQAGENAFGIGVDDKHRAVKGIEYDIVGGLIPYPIDR